MEFKRNNSISQHTLEIFTLGTFDVYKNEEELSGNTQRANRMWDLFKYLLAHEKKRFFPEQVLENLWPDTEYIDPRKAFRQQIHKIRKVLGQGGISEQALEITPSGGGYTLEIKDSCWLDVKEFEELYRKAVERAPFNTEKAIDLYYRTLSLYNGEYLPCIADYWVLPLRNYYRQIYLRSIQELISLLKKTHRNDEVIELCESAFFFEPFEEILHLQYLEALIEDNRLDEARSHYEYITNLIYQKIGVKPSRELQKLYQTIRSNTATPSISSIQELLMKEDEVKGALFCDPVTFHFILNREKYRAEREEALLQVCQLTITTSDFSLPPSEKLNTSAGCIKQILASNLRKNDIVSQLNEAEFVLLLSGLTYEHAEMVLERLRKQFRNNYFDKSIVLRGQAHSISPLVR